MKSSTTEKTLEVLESLFARYRLPRQLVSDNGPQFTAFEFEECMLANGIKHLLSAPYHPATNGEAERFVQTFKKSLRAGKDDSGTVPQKLARFLLTFRATPHATTGMAPAELFLQRQVRTRLDLLKPSVEDHVHDQQLEQKRYHDRHVQERSFQVGQPVLARNLREGAKFVRGSVTRKLEPANYEIMVQGHVWKRHGDQLLAYKGNTNESESGLSEPPESRVPESVSEPRHPLGSHWSQLFPRVQTVWLLTQVQLASYRVLHLRRQPPQPLIIPFLSTPRSLRYRSLRLHVYLWCRPRRSIHVVIANLRTGSNLHFNVGHMYTCS